MSKAAPIRDSAGVKERKDDFVDVNIKEKREDEASQNMLYNTQALMELSPLEIRNCKIPANDELRGQTRATTEVFKVAYRLYKQRWIGLVELVLLNMLFGWNLQILSSISDTAAKYFHVSRTEIHSLTLVYIGTLCSFSPLVVWVIYRFGCRPAFVIAGLALAIGSLIQYVGIICVKFEIIVFANLIYGAGASFVTIMPTHYSDVWFSPAGRMGATTVASLAFPAGSGIGLLVSPLIGVRVQTFSSMVLIASLVSTIVSLGTFFVAAKPPTSASASRSFSKVPLLPAFVLLIRSKNFWLMLVPFAVYFGFASATFCLLGQIFAPHGKSSIAWVCGAIFIGSGLVTGSILPPIIAKYKISLIVLRALCPVMALCFFAFIWVSEYHNPLLPFLVAAILGGASFSLIPITLEFLVDMKHPIAPESTSSLLLVAGLLLSAWFTVIMEIIAVHSSGDSPHSMKNSLIFQAVVSLAVIPLPFCLRPRGSHSIKENIERC